MKIHWLQHVPFEGLGSIAVWAMDHGFPLTGSRLFAGDVLPPPTAFDLLVVMGGPMSANDERVHAWLGPEKRFIDQTIKAGRSVLGICLGAQLIASAAGARVYPNDHKEIGWFPVERTSRASETAVGRALTQRTEVFHWHGETFDLPRGGVHLARSEGCRHQAFALGQRIVGLQYHLETTPQSARALIAHCRHELTDAPYVQSESAMLSNPERFTRLNREMNRLLDVIFTNHTASPLRG
jgi:GMP synthase-like glutamine amidotransferase